MERSSLENVKLVVRTMAQTAVDNEKYFGDLDWDTIEYNDTGTFLKKVSLIITGRIGGTSGPIWGTAFLRASIVAGDKQELEGTDAIAMLRAAIEGIKKRGQADLGDKTLLDALVPAVDQLELALSASTDVQTALQQAAEVARERAEATRELLAKRGRAAYSGERSIGTLDAGAVAVAVMFEQVSEVWE